MSPSHTGSSPLTRGKLDTTDKPINQRRLIPAHAGKTKSVIMTGIARAAHPRSRGENPTSTPLYLRLAGSSPLTRGKPLLLMMCISVFRLIPAHAGKTRSRGGTLVSSPAHPRSRGENRSYPARTTAFVGSSPLTRGKPSRAHYARDAQGLIPAHAGKTPGRPRKPGLRGAHPRSRGENVAPLSVIGSLMGSSPLTRGKRGGGVETE